MTRRETTRRPLVEKVFHGYGEIRGRDMLRLPLLHLVLPDSNARPIAINRIPLETGAVFQCNIRAARISRRFDLREFRSGASAARNARNNIHSTAKHRDRLCIAVLRHINGESLRVRCEIFAINRSIAKKNSTATNYKERRKYYYIYYLHI